MTVRLGFVMLCHTALHRAAEVARVWAAAGRVAVNADAGTAAAVRPSATVDRLSMSLICVLPAVRASKKPEGPLPPRTQSRAQSKGKYASAWWGGVG